MARLNGRDPKKPACADSGLGCGDSMHGDAGQVRHEAAGVASPEDGDERPAALDEGLDGAGGDVLPARDRGGWRACPGVTVSTRLSSSTPWSAHGVRSPLLGVGRPRSVSSSRKMLARLFGTGRTSGATENDRPDRVARASGRGPGRRRGRARHPAVARTRAARGRRRAGSRDRAATSRAQELAELRHDGFDGGEGLRPRRVHEVPRGGARGSWCSSPPPYPARPRRDFLRIRHRQGPRSRLATWAIRNQSGRVGMPSAEDRGDVVEAGRDQAEPRPGAALLALEQPGLDEHLEVVRHRRLRRARRGG